jgi:hypothetical protein
MHELLRPQILIFKTSISSKKVFFGNNFLVMFRQTNRQTDSFIVEFI